MKKLLLVAALAAVPIVVSPDGLRRVYGEAAEPFVKAEGEGSWQQWGGPRRNFMVDAPALADSWPQGGPRKLWERSLGEGHSAILADGNRLYTMYRSVGLL